MSTYVSDTGLFRISRDYYSSVFPSFWTAMEQLIQDGAVSSVDQVYDELVAYRGKQHDLLDFLRNHKSTFTQPSHAEGLKVREIFSVSEFQKILNKKKQLKGGPFADPFVIAKAMVEGSVVVTGELPTGKDKSGNIQGHPKIPNICEYFDVRCITPREFMEEQGWQF